MWLVGVSLLLSGHKVRWSGANSANTEVIGGAARFADVPPVVLHLCTMVEHGDFLISYITRRLSQAEAKVSFRTTDCISSRTQHTTQCCDAIVRVLKLRSCAAIPDHLY